MRKPPPCLCLGSGARRANQAPPSLLLIRCVCEYEASLDRSSGKTLAFCFAVKDILEKRGPYRAEHIEGAKKQARQHRLRMFMEALLNIPRVPILFIRTTASSSR